MSLLNFFASSNILHLNHRFFTWDGGRLLADVADTRRKESTDGSGRARSHPRQQQSLFPGPSVCRSIMVRARETPRVGRLTGLPSRRLACGLGPVWRASDRGATEVISGSNVIVRLNRSFFRRREVKFSDFWCTILHSIKLVQAQYH